MEKYTRVFLNKLLKLTPIEVIGIARFFNISLIDENNLEKDGQELLKEIIDKFNSYSHTKQKRFLKILKKGTK